MTSPIDTASVIGFDTDVEFTVSTPAGASVRLGVSTKDGQDIWKLPLPGHPALILTKAAQ
jgi:hypothetical protein